MSTFRWTDAAVRKALALPADSGGESVSFTAVSTDTRTMSGGELFVALLGEQDGHEFLSAAAAAGARGAIVAASAILPTDLPLVFYPVPDTLIALGSLARYRRRALPAKIIGITGSSGKTSVKELLAAALSATFRVHSTEKNYNNRIGVPLTLLSAPEDTEVVVIEMGTNEPGEISTLAAIAEPDAALLTTVSEAHLEKLGSFDGVMEEKLDLLRGTRPGGPLLTGDLPVELVSASRGLDRGVRSVGFSDLADPHFRGKLLNPDGQGHYTVRALGEEFTSPLPGKHGAQNSLMALAMTSLVGGDVHAGCMAMTSVRSRGGHLRNEVRRIGGLTLVLDCYNANPQSTAAALDLLAEIAVEDGRVAFLATMGELGERSVALHRELLGRARALPIDLVVAVGAYAPHAGNSEGGSAQGLIAADSPEEGYEALRPHLRGTETILLKGSRSTRLEQLIPLFERDFGGAPSVAAGGDI